MKTGKIARVTVVCGLCVVFLLPVTGCSSMKNTWNSMTQAGQGATAGGAAGAAVGTGVGAIIGGGKGAWIGALVGGALGAGTGAAVGNAMDRQRKALEKELASVRGLAERDSVYSVQAVKDSNNLEAIKLVLGNSILFNTNSYSLSSSADAALEKVAYNLGQFPQTDVTVVGYTDNTGTAEINDKLSLERARSVVNFLEQHGVAAGRLKAVGDGWNNPVASNATAAGRAQNRRVEIYITADKQMIANAGKQ